jgi:hypothetical protein
MHPPSSSKGGLLLAWRHGVDIKCFSVSVNKINAWCFSDPPNSPWFLSYIYGPPEKQYKSMFWESLLDEGLGYSGPWMCLGDFNVIMSQTEKFGGRPYACSSNDAFHCFMDSLGMIDLGFSGNPFTWSNKCRGDQLIKEQLDRGIANPKWVHLFPHFFVRHLPAQSSDHNPILLDTAHSDLSLPYLFRFEEFWTFDATCSSVVSEARNNSLSGSPQHNLSNNLTNTTKALKLWNKNHFGNIQAKIVSLLHQLDIIQQAPPSSFSFDLKVSLQSSLDSLILQEESL